MQGTRLRRAARRAIPLLAGTWVTSKWPGRAPDGHVLLRGFLGGGRDPQRLEASDDELVETGARRSSSELLGITGDAAVHATVPLDAQSPQYEVGHLQRVAAIDEHLASLPGMFVTGSGFRAIGIPDCIADARGDRGSERRARYLSPRASRRRDVRFACMRDSCAACDPASSPSSLAATGARSSGHPAR